MRHRHPTPCAAGRSPARLHLLAAIALGVGCWFLATAAFAHGVANRDQAFLEHNVGLAIGPYMYLGAKHMITGYDHLLFLAGVIFFLYRIRDVALYVTLFALGHSVTLRLGVLANLRVDPYMIDAIIGLSVAYKAFENLGGFRAFSLAPDSRLAVLGFGLCHGLGLATKLQPVALSPAGLYGNLFAFNAGVELGQLGGLAVILLGFSAWRSSGRFARHAYLANSALLTAGLVLVGFQLTGFFAA